MLLHPSGAGAPKEEPGVFAGYVGDRVDRCKQFPAGRYTISKKLGAGVYGKVLGCVDQKYNLPVAIKIVRKDPPIYRDAAKKEITVLRHLGGTHGCLRLLRDFEHDGHLCISMEMYGKNLQSFIKSRGKSLDLTAVADIGLQLLHACEYMHSKQVIHTDIKSENILLAAGPEGSYTIKLVDMGSSLFTSWWHPPIIGTMEYRAPETLLQAGWSWPVDNFATGAVLVELNSGKYLLPGVREEEHLKAIEIVMEMKIPQVLMRRGRKNANQYNKKLIVKRGNEYVIPETKLQYPAQTLRSLAKDPEFYSLCRGLLSIDPDERLCATRAKAHAFFNRSNFDATKVDESFCLRTRDDFEKPLEVSAASTMPVGEKIFSDYLAAEVVDDDSLGDIIEGEAPYNAPDVPPPRPPPPAPKPLPRSDSTSSGSSAGSAVAGNAAPIVIKNDAATATRAAAPAISKESKKNKYISPVLGPSDAIRVGDYSDQKKGKGKEGAETKENMEALMETDSRRKSGQKPGLAEGASTREMREGADTEKVREMPTEKAEKPPPREVPNLPSPQVSASVKRGSLVSPCEQEIRPAQAAKQGGGTTETTQTGLAATEVQREQQHVENMLQADGITAADTVSPHLRPAGFISGILNNLTTSVKTSLSSSPVVSPANSFKHKSVPLPPSMSDDANASDGAMNRKLSASPSKGPAVKEGKENGWRDADSNWECDLSDRLSRLHERLSRLRQESAAFAEGTRQSKRKGTAPSQSSLQPRGVENSS